jgi:hypothetical protein
LTAVIDVSQYPLRSSAATRGNPSRSERRLGLPLYLAGWEGEDIEDGRSGWTTIESVKRWLRGSEHRPVRCAILSVKERFYVSWSLIPI